MPGVSATAAAVIVAETTTRGLLNLLDWLTRAHLTRHSADPGPPRVASFWARIRHVQVLPDGVVYVLTEGANGKLLKVTLARQRRRRDVRQRAQG